MWEKPKTKRNIKSIKVYNIYAGIGPEHKTNVKHRKILR
jgi:hypothetical protein